MSRRSFLESILIACAAPAIVRADSLMRIVPRELTVLSSTVIATAWDSVILPGFTGTIRGMNYLNGRPWQHDQELVDRMLRTREMIALGVLKEAHGPR